MPKPEIRNPGLAIKRRKNEEFRHLSQRRNSVLVFFIIRCKDRKFFPLVQIFWLKSLLFHFFILPLHRIFPKRCNPANCPDGGIGRRVGLKHQCRKASRFDPGSGYKAFKKTNKERCCNHNKVAALILFLNTTIWVANG